jgi:hypothetical protein
LEIESDRPSEKESTLLSDEEDVSVAALPGHPEESGRKKKRSDRPGSI